MPLEIVRNDITKMNVDAIVNSTNSALIPGGTGVDASIHSAAGPELAGALEKIGYCPLGGAVYTDAFDIRQCRYIIHTAGPVFEDGESGEREILESCYSSVLNVASKLGCRTVAVPILSSGAYGYPPEDAYRIATSSVRKYFEENDSEITVYIVVFGSELVEISRALDRKVTQYITDYYVDLNRETLETADAEMYENRFREEVHYSRIEPEDGAPFPDGEKYERKASGQIKAKRRQERPRIDVLPSMTVCGAHPEKSEKIPVCCAAGSAEGKAGMPDYKSQDLSFAEMCQWWCKTKGISSQKFYARANITRQAFWNMKKHPEQLPKKTTLFACVIGLELTLEEAEDILSRAGITFSRFYLTDCIVRGCIENGIYDIDAINSELYDRDQTLLGASAY